MMKHLCGVFHVWTEQQHGVDITCTCMDKIDVIGMVEQQAARRQKE